MFTVAFDIAVPTDLSNGSMIWTVYGVGEVSKPGIVTIPGRFRNLEEALILLTRWGHIYASDLFEGCDENDWETSQERRLEELWQEVRNSKKGRPPCSFRLLPSSAQLEWAM